METNKVFLDYLANNYPDSIILDNMDEAIIGIDTDEHIIYSHNKCVECLMEHDGMTGEEAMEWVDYNTIRAIPYMGDKHPIIMYNAEDF